LLPLPLLMAVPELVSAMLLALEQRHRKTTSLKFVLMTMRKWMMA